MPNIRHRTFPACVVLLTISLGGCVGGSGTAGLPAPPTEGPEPSTTAAAPSVGEPQVFEVGASQTHPNGAQLRVDRVEVFDDAIVVQAAVTNGSLYGITLDKGATELRSADGSVAGLMEPLRLDPIDPGADIDLSLRFRPLGTPQTLVLAVNVGGGSSPVNPSTSVPSFEVGPFVLDAGQVRPGLPEPVFVDRSMVHANGVELQVSGFVFTDNRIGVWVRVANPAAFDVTMAARTVAPSLLVDDLGNRYPIMLSDDENVLRVPAGTARSGVLSFAGKIHPGARSLAVLLNQTSDRSTTGPGAPYPRFTVEDIPLTGEEAVALPDPVTAGSELAHPNGTVVMLDSLRFGTGSIEVDVTISTPPGGGVSLAGAPTFAEDDVGNRYPLIPPGDDRSLQVGPSTAAEATLSFSGRIDPRAGEVTVRFNAGESGTSADTATPAFVFGPYPLQRSSAAQTPEALLFAVPPVSRLDEELLVASEVDQVAQTLVQFGATEVEEGVQLSLPDDVLFDFNSSDLRDDARQTLGLIADVLEYFAGDPVRVIGHTDSIGRASYNQQLSEARARSVVDALIADHGVAPERLTAEGRGASEPIAPNTTPDGSDNPEGRQLNRRVDIVVVTDKPIPTS